MHARRTSLYPRHEAAGAKFTEFAGWEMPVQYPRGTLAEHHATRNSVGIFDVSHMGRIRVTGSSAGEALARIVSADITRLDVGRSTYALLCREDGGVIDDLFIYRTEETSYLVVVNAARRERDITWIRDHLPEADVRLRDVSDETAMIAVQGPRAAYIVESVLGSSVGALPRFGIATPTLIGDGRGRSETLEAARTGYTGEDGFELFPAAHAAPDVWDELFAAAERLGIAAVPAGLAARDSLRLEAGFALYGHELTEDISPVEARLTWACDLEHDFIGREAILQKKDQRPAVGLVRLITEEAGVPREGYPVINEDGEELGRVVSGGRAPSIDRFIANAYIDRSKSESETMWIQIRARPVRARVHRGPVYKGGYRTIPPTGDLFTRAGEFAARHLGPDSDEEAEMLQTIGVGSARELIDTVVPPDIRRRRALRIPEAMSEDQVSAHLRRIAARNEVRRSLIGQGYADTITPPVIQRNILENPRWYTQYTPYQAEISQGRLEALVNYQTMVAELTGMEIANASMLDEATAAAEAITMAIRRLRNPGDAVRVWVDSGVHPQTIEHLRMRARPIDVEIVVAPANRWKPAAGDAAGIMQYPDTSGAVRDFSNAVEQLHAVGATAIAAADLLALTLLTPPGEWGADIVVGNSQRFGVPLGYGGPHAAFLATRNSMKRLMPGRLVGVSRDATGKPAMRLALQTREQHIRRDKATSNICTAQVLPAILASMYAVYHGPEGLARIAVRVTVLAHTLREVLQEHGFPVVGGDLFDTVTLSTDPVEQQRLTALAARAAINLRTHPDGRVGIALDEKSSPEEMVQLLRAFGIAIDRSEFRDRAAKVRFRPGGTLERRTPYLTDDVFRTHRSETAMLRYITRLQNRDLSLADSMIPLGSCTMKLNPTAAMMPITWPEFAAVHPYAPRAQAAGFYELADELAAWLCDITGFSGCTLQPNSGAQGEYTGLMMIRSWHESRGQQHRRVCLVPDSAHGTNPASATMAGMQVVVVNSAENGDIDLDDLRAKADVHAESLAAMMITYPSTHGVFEQHVAEAIRVVHERGGQVYLDGANMNAQVGITSPGDIGADVCHLNLHKTFAIPHGGGGPGVGPVLTAAHLVPFLPGTVAEPGPTGVVAAAPLGSAGVLPISYAYIAMLGPEGLERSTRGAVLAANYVAARLRLHVPVAFSGPGGFVAHECILDFRHIEHETGVTVEDVAKRLADYGFHAPTMSWPLPDSLMVEPTESENKAELDRFCDAMIAILGEIDTIRRGEIPLEQSPLRRAPHTAESITGEWDRPYSREVAVYPAPWVRRNKFWPAVARVDNVYGDRNLVCTCAPLEAYRP